MSIISQENLDTARAFIAGAAMDGGRINLIMDSVISEEGVRLDEAIKHLSTEGTVTVVDRHNQLHRFVPLPDGRIAHRTPVDTVKLGTPN